MARVEPTQQEVATFVNLTDIAKWAGFTMTGETNTLSPSGLALLRTRYGGEDILTVNIADVGMTTENDFNEAFREWRIPIDGGSSNDATRAPFRG